MLHKASIAGLAMDPSSNTPIVILKPDDREQVVPIWIGLLEATAIASALKNVNFERPMTHDLFKNFSEKLDATLIKIDIVDIKDNTYYARLYFEVGGQTFDMDSRPSDAIALALRFDAPIFLDDKVIQKASTTQGDAEMMDTSEEGQKWADYLEKLEPDDFGKYKV